MNGGELLRQHGEFVRSLARVLVRDPHRADDVAQETWLRWFTRPPRDRSRPRGWLASVARSVAANEHRSTSRRAEREHDRGGNADSPSSLDESLQAELVTRVIAAVMALETPLRDVILAHHFRGVTLAELARTSGVNEETLRARERRALELLRAKLDRDFGQRTAWAVGLGEFARRAPFVPAPSGASAATAAHGTLWLAAGVLAVTSGLGVVLWKARTTEGETLEAAAAAASLAPASATPASSSEYAPDGAREVLASAAQGSGGGDDGASSSSAVTSGQVTVHGTFRFEDGAPAAGASWAFSGWESNEEAVIRYGLPEDWTDPTGTTDAQGELHASFFPPQAFQFVLEVSAPGHAAAEWRWGQLAPGSTLELGEVTLQRGVTLTGRMVDANGQPLIGEEWRVYADSIGLEAPSGEGRDETSVSAAVDPATGSFVLEDVHPGRVALKAHNRMANWIRAPRVTVTPGETRAVDIVYSGPRNSERITVTTFCRLHVLSNPAPGSIELVAADGTRRVAQQIVGSSQSYSFDGLASGEYVVEVHDPRYLTFVSAPVTPGHEVRANLEPCSLLVLDVRDANNQVLEPERVTLEFVGANFMPRELVVHESGMTYTGQVRVPPGDFLVRITRGADQAMASVADVGFDETRTVTLALANQARIAGHLKDPSGAGLAGIELLLLSPAQEQDSDASPILRPNSWVSDEARHRKQRAMTTTDDQGAFEFLVPMAGGYVVHASSGNGLAVNSPVLSLAAGESRTDLALVAPFGASVTGRLLASTGSLAGLRVWFGKVTEDAPPMEMDATAHEVAADGSFQVDGLPAGTLAARLLLPAGSWQFAWEELGTLELAAGQTLQHDFTLAAAPGTLALDATVDGTVHQGVRVTLTRQTATQWQRIQTALGPDGRLSQKLFAGTWSVQLADPAHEWSTNAPGVSVPSGGNATLSVPIVLAQGTLRFLDAQGQPLAKTRVRFERADEDDEGGLIQAKTTDADGRVTFLLVPGEYVFAAFPEGVVELAPGTQVTWTTTGPTVSDVQL